MLRLLLDYGLRKGALRGVHRDDFDRQKLRLTITTKGEKIQTLPIPDPAVWRNLALIDEPGEHYLVPEHRVSKRQAPKRKQLDRMAALLEETAALLIEAAEDGHAARELGSFLSALHVAQAQLELVTAAATTRIVGRPGSQIGEHGLHLHWYRCLARAGIVEPGTTAGRRMHGARHTAAQRVLERTGNLKAAQVLLGHATIGTTGDIYSGWETEQLTDTLLDVIPGLRK